MVLFAVLSNEPAQAFVAAGSGPVGDAVIQPTPYPGGFRPAMVVGAVGKEGSGRVALVVYKQPGDPYRDGTDALMQRLGDVPYSKEGVPGTWTYDDRPAVERPSEAPATGDTASAVTAKMLTGMKKDELFAHAAAHNIDLEGVTTAVAALPIVAKHHKITLPA